MHFQVWEKRSGKNDHGFLSHIYKYISIRMGQIQCALKIKFSITLHCSRENSTNTVNIMYFGIDYEFSVG